MDISKLNQAFVTIVEKKEQLRKITSNDPLIHQLNEELNALEAAFQLNYGPFLEEALFNVHDEYCPDNDVKYPLSYIAPKYSRHQNGDVYYDVEEVGGVSVEADDFPGIHAHLVLVPNPTRLVLMGDKEEFKEVVWVARSA